MIQYLHAHPALLLILILLVIWSAIWKGIALWKAARLGDKTWFIVLFIVNTAGILEIFYIFGFSRRTILPEDNIDQQKAKEIL